MRGEPTLGFESWNLQPRPKLEQGERRCGLKQSVIGDDLIAGEGVEFHIPSLPHPFHLLHGVPKSLSIPCNELVFVKHKCVSLCYTVRYVLQIRI